MQTLIRILWSNLLSFIYASVVLATTLPQKLPPKLPPHSHSAPTPGTPPNPVLMQGAYLFKLGSCNACHTADKTKPLAGGYKLQTDFGYFITPNISPDVETGIGAWSDIDFLVAMRKGVSPRGTFYYPSFPYQNFSKMSDADILAIKAYIMIQPGYKQTNPKSDLTWPYSDRGMLNLWQAIFFPEVVKFNDINFRTAQGPLENIPTHTPEWNRGAYLVEGPLHCTECHTPRAQLGSLDVDKWMAGAPLAGSKNPAPNITPAAKTGLAAWTVADWTHLLQNGVNTDGDEVGGDMKILVDRATSKLKKDDLAAVITYLMQLPPIENDVAKPAAK